MQVELKKLKGLQRKVVVTVSAERVDEAYDKRVKEVAKTVKLQGFRPGKVPANVVQQQFGSSIRQEVDGKLIETTLYEALREKELRPAGVPKVEPKPSVAGQPLEYEAEFEVFPEFTVAGMEGIKIQKLKPSISDKDVTALLDKLRKQHAVWAKVDRAAKLGDQVVMDFEGTIKKEKFEGGSAKGATLELGSNQFIPGFEGDVVGMKAGDEKDVKVKFPKDYHAEEFAGKAATFAVKVHEVKEAALPKLDDEFAKSLHIEGGVDTLKKEVHDNMGREAERAVKDDIKKQVLDAFLSKNKIDLPEALVDQEIEQLQSQMQQRMAMAMGKESAAKLPRASFEEDARRRVGLGLILSEYIQKHEIKADQDRVKKMVEDIAKSYQQPEQIVAWYYQNKEQLAQIEFAALEEQIVDAVVKDAKVTEKTVSYEEAVSKKEAK